MPDPFWDKELLTDGWFLGPHYIQPGMSPDPALLIPASHGGKIPALPMDYPQKVEGRPSYEEARKEAAERADNRFRFFRDLADDVETIVAIKALKELWENS